ncbi:hypothetical protein VNO80_28273 [Phaseolus coccineus]|uniref:MTHFR SAM-binding regulatory domain-containing protein n=1 Tax=Phaseolus coccineus TaxID=3886 RepID=A0AAN9LDW2_PHACN
MILMPLWKPPKPQYCGYNYGCRVNCNLKPWISCELYWVPTLENKRFRMYCIGKLRSNPWSELDGLQPETKIINEQLERINTKGFLTINSQPAVNGEKSDSPTGGPGGYVYQKAYVEFFCSKEKLDTLVDKCKDRTSLTYMAVNKEGSWKSNVGQTDVNAVTDPVSFNVWKDELFEIWSRGWASLYPEGDASRKLVEELDARALIILCHRFLTLASYLFVL